MDEDKDAFLWDTLLKLVQVRGKDWAHRWDAVRMAIGLEPRISSDSEIEGDEGNSTSAESDKAPEGPRSNTKTMTTRAEIEALRKRMALLTAEAGSLVGTISRKQETEGVASILASRENRLGKAGGRSGPPRTLRFAEQESALRARGKASNKATVVESASDEEASRARVLPQRSSVAGRVDGRSAAAQRQFDEVVARSRSEREAQRKVLEEKRDADEEASLAPLLDKADKLSSIHLTRKCLLWWRTSFEQRQDRERQAHRARDELVTGKAYKAWRSKVVKRREQMRGAQKVDIVRCKLRAWRVWTRTLHEARQVRKEEKRSLLKGAYALTRRKTESRVVGSTFLRWKLKLMERRTAHFRTQHLVRGAFSLWRLHLWKSKTLHDREVVVRDRIRERLLGHTWDKWTEATRVQSMLGLAHHFHRNRLLHSAFTNWTTARSERATIRRKEALADRWRARRSKRTALRRWQSRMGGVEAMEQAADRMRNTHLDVLRGTMLRLWLLREREALYARVVAAKLTAQAISAWSGKHRRLSARLKEQEALVVERRRTSSLARTFSLWRDTTRQIVTSQHLASERDRRKVKIGTFRRWRDALCRREAEVQRAETIDALLLQRQMLAVWIRRHAEAKAEQHLHYRNLALMRTSLAFWRAQSAQRRQEAWAVDMIRGKIEARIKRKCLDAWTTAVIERKSQLMEAGEQRDAVIVERVWVRWIEACLRHEDLLSLCNSLIDVKKEDRMRRAFSRWATLARAEQNRRERVEQFLREKRRTVAQKSLEQWYDRYVEATLRPLEYEALLQRQRTALVSAFGRWRGQTSSLPAIRLDHARCKSHAFYKWLQRLPLARKENAATRWDRRLMQEKGFEHWHAVMRTRRALRAAARFGGPSAVRLRATAHLRPRGSGNPYGGASSSSSPVPLRTARARSFDRSRLIRRALPEEAPQQKEEQSSLRESDLVPDRGAVWDAAPGRSNVPPGLQRWMQEMGQGKQGTTLDEAEASSEPPSSVLDHKRPHRRSDPVNRTPSPPASRAQSEVTVRVKASPRKAHRMGDNGESTMDVLRARRRQRRSMIIDDG